MAEFSLNGQRVAISGTPVHTTLLDFLRDHRLTGAKEGCAEGECGACTVLTVAHTPQGTAYRPVNSCLLFLPMLADHEIFTVEALARNGELAPAQAAMAAAGGSQCGYCTPGFVMSLFAEHYRPARTGSCDPHSMGGNLCRCTGYRPIRDAALSLGAPPDDDLRRRLDRPAPLLDTIDYEAAGARFLRPTTLEECFAIQRRHPDVRWIAGATDLALEANLRFRRWPVLAALEAVPELRTFTTHPNRISIGAAIPLADIEAHWTSAPAAFRDWVPLFASPSLRNRATLGGNLATASPIGDGAPLLIALGAEIELASERGRRTLPLESFFTAYRRTAAEPGELIARIHIPSPTPAVTRFYKIAKRAMDDISTVAAAIAIDLDAAGRVTHARIAFGGVAATPLRAVEAEDAIIGRPFTPATIERAQTALRRTLAPISDHRGSAEYRTEVACSVLEKFWHEHQQEAAA